MPYRASAASAITFIPLYAFHLQKFASRSAYGTNISNQVRRTENYHDSPIPTNRRERDREIIKARREREREREREVYLCL
jgi:hypothetical protein